MHSISIRNENLALIIVTFTDPKTRQSTMVPLNKSTIAHSCDQYPLITISKFYLPATITYYHYGADLAERIITSYSVTGFKEIKIDPRGQKIDTIVLRYDGLDTTLHQDYQPCSE